MTFTQEEIKQVLMKYMKNNAEFFSDDGYMARNNAIIDNLKYENIGMEFGIYFTADEISNILDNALGGEGKPVNA